MGDSCGPGAPAERKMTAVTVEQLGIVQSQITDPQCYHVHPPACPKLCFLLSPSGRAPTILPQTAPSRALDWQKHRLKSTDAEVKTARADRHFM